MSEQAYDFGLMARRAMAGATIASLALVSGCAASKNGLPSLPTAEALPGVARCFDDPIDFDSRPDAWPKSIAQTPLSLTFNPNTQRIVGEPTPSSRMQELLRNANVIVSTPGQRGSGVMILGPNGEELVVTDAHVLAGTSTEDIKIANDTESVGIERVCYVLQRKNELTADVQLATDYNDQGVDFAILRPKKPLDGTPLKLATAPPQKGDWVEFTNYGAPHSIGHPAQFLGIVLGRGIIMDGLQAWRYGTQGDPDTAAHGILRYAVTGGASGGEITKDLEVIAFVLGAPAVADPGSLKMYNTTIKGGDTSPHLSPTATVATPANAVSYTLQHSSRY